MRDRLASAPWWVLSLVTGGLFGAITFALNVLQRGTGQLLVTLIGAVIGGVIFGGIMGPVTARLNKGAREALGSLPHARTRDVRRAARGGPVPHDPQVRAAAARLASWQLETMSKVRVPGIVLFGAFTALAVFLAITSTPWWWLMSGGSAAACFFYWWWPKRISHRVAVLKEAQPRQ